MYLSVNIKKYLGERLLHIEFETNEGWIGVLGASGIGKSMMLKCIAGIETPDSGYIIYNGLTFFDSSCNINLPIKERGVGYLFQSYALFPHLTVYQNITCAYRNGPDQEVMTSLMKKFKIEALAHLYPKQLSGGQKQRVALARMIAVNPKLILLDEPFSALDYDLKKNLQKELIAFLNTDGRTIILVSHDLKEIKALCTHMFLISAHKNTQLRSVEEVLCLPSTYQEALLCQDRNVVAIEQSEYGEIYIPEWRYTFSTERCIGHPTHIMIVASHMKLAQSDVSNAFLAEGISVEEKPFSYRVTTTNPSLTLEIGKQEWEVYGDLNQIYITFENQDVVFITQ